MSPTLLRRACLPGLALGATAAIAALPRVGRALTVPAISGRPPIALGLVWGGDAEGWLAEGVEFARDEINRDGGVLGSQIELVRRTIDPTMPDPRAAAVEVARRLCQRGDVLAVIGHSRAEEAIPAAITYDQNGLIFLNPRVTRRALNDCGFLRTFTSVPTDSMIAQQIATFAFGLGYRRFMVLRSREDFAEDLTIAFAYQVSRLGMTIVEEHSFTPSHTNFKDIVADLGARQFDAILIAAQPNQTVALIRQSHGVHLDVPFLIGGFVPVPAILAEIGKSTTPVAVPVLFNPDSSFPPAVRFRQGFKTRYGAEPDEWAAQGYDAVRLLAAAIKAGDKADAGSVATVMRYALSWKGVTGRYSFDRAGRIYTKQLKFATIDQDGVRYHDVDE